MPTVKQQQPSDNPSSKQISEIIKYLIIIGGEKGGVGKSFLTRYLLSFLIRESAESEIVCYDADPSVDDVYQLFSDKPWMEKAFFTLDKYRVQEGSIIVSKIKPMVIVNLPSNIRKNFDNFCEQNKLFEEELQQETYETCYFFFVSDGSYQSVKLFVEHLERYKDKPFLKTVLFLNAGQNGNSYDFSYLGNKNDFDVLSNLANQIKTYKVPVLTIPELPPLIRFKVDALLSEKGLKFHQLITKGESELITLERLHFQGHLTKFDNLFKELFEFKKTQENNREIINLEKIKYDDLVKNQETLRNQERLFVA
ncbi:hypothetical protein [Crocosphaera sp.]|uniref:hypothetical protein n=1 Tax=Crocosphaera sp. TaxID=2729996 RepID=UPI0025805324|nr:hypothetical protein [Crocosphaera sp.]NQZ64204.1 hypothetical protein [Crocosphaera sp.]